MNKVSSLRKLIVIRHAERVDLTSGTCIPSEWIPSSFDDKGNYIRRDLNMPVSMLPRTGGPMDYLIDPPLTQIGLYQATLTGDGMLAYNLKFDHVFCSPSLRCIQTCTNVLKAANKTHLKINIEPGLYEFGGWYNKIGMPSFLTLPELQKHGFNISLDYEPVVDILSLNTSESIEMYYNRSLLVTKKILDSYSGNILLLGHSGTIDACTRQLTGEAPRSVPELFALVQKIPYASVCVAEEQPNQTWKIVDSLLPALKHCDNLGFDLHVLK